MKTRGSSSCGTSARRMVRLCSLALLAAALSSGSAGCGRESRQGAADINPKPDQAGPAAPFGLNRIGRGNAYGTRSINMNDLDHAHRHGAGVINQAAREGGRVLDGTAAESGAGTPTQSGTNMNTNREGYAGAGGGANVEASQTVADAVAGLDEVKTANVLLAGRSAYVAVVLEYGAGVSNAADSETNNRTVTDISDQVKGKVADKVKSVNTSVQNVYVSASPDFVERMSAFRQDLQNGKPAAGFIKEFYNVIERVFPTRAGNNNPVLGR